MQTTQRLVELYHRATVDSGRFEQVERRRFLLHLIEKLKAHRDTIGAPLPAFNPLEPWKLFAHRRAAYQGKEMASAFAFIIDELQSRIGVRALCDTLYRCSNDVSLALARRLSTPRATASLKLSALRMLVNGTAHDVELSGTCLSFGECARHDAILSTPPDTLHLAIGIDNCGTLPAHFPCVEVRVQVQTQANAPLRSTNICVFGSLLRVEAGQRAWIGLGGVDLLGELRSELAPGEDIYALRFLLTRK